MRNDRPMPRTLTSRCYRPVATGPGGPDKLPRMLRHVVLFTWSDAADADRRAATLAGLRRLPDLVGGMTSFAVGDDLGLREGNAHTALVADFPDVETYRRYPQDPEHLAIIAEHITPYLAARSSVQYEL